MFEESDRIPTGPFVREFVNQAISAGGFPGAVLYLPPKGEKDLGWFGVSPESGPDREENLITVAMMAVGALAASLSGMTADELRAGKKPGPEALAEAMKLVENAVFNKEGLWLEIVWRGVWAWRLCLLATGRLCLPWLIAWGR